MIKIKIEEDKNITTSTEILLLDKPNYICIPLINKSGSYLPLIKKGDYVYQEEKIALRKVDHFPIFSSVSGIVDYVDSKEIKIKNDFKNRVRDYQMTNYDLSKYHKNQISKLLFELGIRNIGEIEVEPYQKLDPNLVYKCLIINALQGDAYLYLEAFQLKVERKQLLEMMECLLDIYNFEEVLIVVSKTQTLLLEEWKQGIQDPRIRLVEVEEYYTLSNTRELIWSLKNIKYKKNPIEKGIVLFNVSTLYSIYQALKYQRPQTKILLQFTGNMWKKNCYMEVRIGTYLKEVLKKLQFKRSKEVLLLSSGNMKGTIVDFKDTVINVETPIYSAWKVTKEINEESCIRCGECTKVCPVHLQPVLIMDALSKHKNMKRFHVDQCIECGLCSYVCPSNIPIYDCMSKAKERIE